MSIKKKIENVNVAGLAKGVANKVTNRNQKLAEERAKICTSCVECVEEPNELFKVKDKIKEISEKMCNACGCALPFKIRVKKEKCPLNKW